MNLFRPLAVLCLAGSSLGAAELARTFRNDAPLTLVLEAQAGPSQQTFYLTHHGREWADQAEFEHQHRVCPAEGDRVRLRVRPGETVVFRPDHPGMPAGYARFELFQEGSGERLGALEYTVLPYLQHASLVLEVAPGEAQRLLAVEHAGGIFSADEAGCGLEARKTQLPCSIL